MAKSSKTRGHSFVQNQAPLPEKLEIACSPIALPETGPLKRLPRHPNRSRPTSYVEAFDAHQLFYDVFWHKDGKRILAVGPAPQNLKSYIKRAKWIALPSGKALDARLYSSVSVGLVELSSVPEHTTHVTLQLKESEWTVPVRENLVRVTTGSKVLFTMNKNNDLSWIQHWARWHVQLHGTDTIFLFDNGSDRYPIADIEQALSEIEGLQRYSVIDFPHKFGPIDPAVRLDPFWANFAQISSMSIVLRRVAGTAQAILNCDIDELANPPDGRSLYEVVQEARQGLVILPGRWVEPDLRSGANPLPAHAQFELVHRELKVRNSSPVKWILDPNRSWVEHLSVHPYWHWVHKRPPFGKSFVSGAHFWHFRGINTGWKLRDRLQSRAQGTLLEVDQELRATRERLSSL